MATPTMAAPTTAMAYTCHGHTRRLAMATHPQACPLRVVRILAHP